MKRISNFVSHNESVKSMTATRRGIDNSPNFEQHKAMVNVAERCFEPLREWYGKALGISSMFRSSELNIAIGGSKNSQHCKGEAMDIDADIYANGISNEEIFDWLRLNVEFDQLIAEYFNEEANDYGWIHISCKLNGDNRNQILIAEKINGRTHYVNYV